ncbi:hypothetical protein P691DRAFT_762747 [Macrolepiota fuliginosa MF-IS2]|uniref:Uncharacterized protein n=1 Tax=Macrolepiota fuliginosa MF-IS2 TaxID=1400762 RepID=A0A9P5X6V3_9AGAR|nr:hypothetical protein P691DRAFT_762747 [Macrolepiota fuliginosa MF-IS2]
MATWSIDGGSPNQFIIQGLPNSTSAGDLFDQVYFITPEVQQGSHALTVTFLGSNQTTPLCIGSLFIKNGSFPSTSTQASSTQSPVSSTDTQVPNTQSPQLPLGTILGGVLGGLALLLLVLVGSFLYWRRQLRARTGSTRFSLTPTSPSGDQHPSLNSPNFYSVMSQVNQHRNYSSSKPSMATPTPEQPQSGVHWRKQREAHDNRESQGNFSLLPDHALTAGDERRGGPQPIEHALPCYTRS